MTPTRGATVGEDHRLAWRASQTELPTMTDPAPALDEAVNDPGCRDTWGNQLGKKHQDSIRICFQNVGGLVTTTDGDLKLTVLRHFTQQFHIDVFAFAEHNICWDLIPKQQQLAERTRGWWENAHWAMGYNKREKYPIAHQPGGTGIAVLNKLSHRALKPGGDQTGLGRWCWVRVRGQSGQILRIVLAYRPCYSSGPLSTYQQQVRYLATINCTDSPKKSS